MASLFGLPVAEVRPLLAELTAAHLAAEPAPGRFAVHDLLRAYAAELAGECEEATRRLLDHYLHMADAADRLLVPDREPLPPLPPGVTVEPVADPMAWFATEHAALVAAVTHSSHAAPLARRLTTYFDRRAHWRDWATAERAAIAAADGPEARRGQARALNLIGWCQARLDAEEASETCAQAVALHRELGDRYGEAASWDSLGHAHHQLGHHDKAVDCYERAAALHHAAGEQSDEAQVLIHLGDTHAAAGDSGRAAAAWQAALTMLAALDHPGAEQVRTRLA